MTIQQLQYILEVNRVGTITQAAKNLFVSHSSVSNAIRALEEELGFPVFERSWQGAIPTRQGAKVLEHARLICEHQKLILQTGQAQRTVCIETGPWLPLSRAFTLLADHCCDEEDLSLCHQHKTTVTNGEGKTPQERVANFESDLYVDVFHSGDPTIPALRRFAFQKNLICEVRATLPGVARIGPNHPLYHKPDLTLKDLEMDTFIDTPKALVANSKMFGWKLGFSPHRILRAADSATRNELLAAGLGFSISGQMPHEIDRQWGFRNIPIPDLTYQVISATNSLAPAIPAVQHYLRLLDDLLSDICIK